MMRIVIFLYVVMGVIINVQSQNNFELGLSTSVVRFSDKNAAFIGDKHMFQIPMVHANYLINKKLSVGVELSFNTINNIGIMKNTVKYNSFGGSIRYHFRDVSSIFEPYVFLGGTMVKSERKRTPTLNFGIGNTYWITNKLGVNTQVIYKFSEKRFRSMKSHFNFTLGVVYNFNFSLFNRKRIWEVKH